MQYTLHLSSDNLFYLHKHAETNLPNESAALIFGNLSGNSIIAKHIELVLNESTSSIISFKVNPEEQYRLFTEAEERTEELVCIFHSHPAPPYPSKTDIQNMKLNPVAWLIASKESGDWESRAYLMNEETVEEIKVILS
ncbi:MAG: M67 family metallopeptidase [Candidatus Thorarchaeota archaeon]